MRRWHIVGTRRSVCECRRQSLRLVVERHLPAWFSACQNCLDTFGVDRSHGIPDHQPQAGPVADGKRRVLELDLSQHGMSQALDAFALRTHALLVPNGLEVFTAQAKF